MNEQTIEKLKLNGYAVFKEWAYENIRGRDLEVGKHIKFETTIDHSRVEEQWEIEKKAKERWTSPKSMLFI